MMCMVSLNLILGPVGFIHTVTSISLIASQSFSQLNPLNKSGREVELYKQSVVLHSAAILQTVHTDINAKRVSTVTEVSWL